nr:MAG TPA: hypothetical protein [Bacteriophage sp.]
MIDFDIEKLSLHSKIEAETYADLNDIMICDLTDKGIKLFGNNMNTYTIPIKKLMISLDNVNVRVLSVNAATKQIIIKDQEFYLILDEELKKVSEYLDFKSAYKALRGN